MTCDTRCITNLRDDVTHLDVIAAIDETIKGFDLSRGGARWSVHPFSIRDVECDDGVRRQAAYYSADFNYLAEGRDDFDHRMLSVWFGTDPGVNITRFSVVCSLSIWGDCERIIKAVAAVLTQFGDTFYQSDDCGDDPVPFVAKSEA